jgi:hypothetical protein
MLAAVTMVVLALSTRPAAAQEKQGSAAAPPAKAASKQLGKARGTAAAGVPRTPDGKPDLSGVWLPGRTIGPSPSPSFQPWAQTLYQQHKADPAKYDPAERCLPTGVPRIPPTPYKVVQTPPIVVILFEGNIHSFRQIFVDGRNHRLDVQPTWYGDSVGNWEGDTLVADTVGFNDQTWLDSDGKPHSEALHVIERFRRPDAGHLEIQYTIEDAKALTKPYAFTRISPLAVKREIREYICNENNAAVQRIISK